MTGWLLDTNVLSELRKPHCAAKVKVWFETRQATELFVSSITFAEIRFGIGLMKDVKRRHLLTRWLDQELRPWFQNRVIELEESVILRWRQMVEEGRIRGHTYSQPDLFLAATADVKGLTLVTRNTSDFVGTGVVTEDPWN